MPITGSTRIVGIFGDPVAHSLSPLMQNAALRLAGIDAVYVPFHVTPARLPGALAAIRSLGLVGVNLTIPHKEAACGLVDELDPAAALIGAINTVVHRDGRLLGYNTDAPGLLMAIGEALDLSVAGRRVLVTGAGGAARAAVLALAQGGAAWIGVANRTPERAERLTAELAPHFQGTAFAAFPLTAELPERLEAKADLLVNSSAAGLHGETLALRPEECVSAGGAVYDMVYATQATPLVAAARAAGLQAADGRGMLAAQGEEAFRLWFGQPAPAGVMRAALDR
jgi:shikimate dehydrogenase